MTVAFEEWLAALQSCADSGEMHCRNLLSRIRAPTFETDIPVEIRQSYMELAGDAFEALTPKQKSIPNRLTRVHDVALEAGGNNLAKLGDSFKWPRGLMRAVSSGLVLDYLIDKWQSSCPVPRPNDAGAHAKIIDWLATHGIVTQPGAKVRGKSDTTVFATCRKALAGEVDLTAKEGAALVWDLLGLPAGDVNFEVVVLQYPDSVEINLHRPTMLDSGGDSCFVAQPASPPFPRSYRNWGATAVVGAERVRRIGQQPRLGGRGLRGMPEAVHKPIDFTPEFKLYRLGRIPPGHPDDVPDLSAEISEP